MAYTIYTSEGVVLSHAVAGEAALIVRVYTKEFGAITVRAENGARSAKFAPSLQVGTIGLYDFVRSRSGYRLTGVRPLFTVQADTHDIARIQFVRQCCAYIIRFVPDDEGADAELYAFFVGVLAYSRSNDWTLNWWNSFRMKTLQILGYVPLGQEFSTRESMEHFLQSIEITTHL